MSMKLAVVETGGKQYKISPGETITIEKLPEQSASAKKITFEKVLLLDDGKEVRIGTPYIEGAKVEAEFIESGKGKKISVSRFKSKTRHFRRRGHRQPYTKVKIK